MLRRTKGRNRNRATARPKAPRDKTTIVLPRTRLPQRFDRGAAGHVPIMTIASLLTAGLITFVLLVPTLMVAVLVSGVSRRPTATDPSGELTDESADLPTAA